MTNITHFRKKLCEELHFFAQQHPEQQQTADAICQFILSTPECFERHHKAGHITGSAWLINPAGNKVLLTLHRKLRRWMQTGGHADGEPEPLRVALREAEEESGIPGITPASTTIFDIDIHLIPANKDRNEPAHYHYDIRYLLRAPHEDFIISEESEALAWWEEADFGKQTEELDASILRMFTRYFG